RGADRLPTRHAANGAAETRATLFGISALSSRLGAILRSADLSSEITLNSASLTGGGDNDPRQSSPKSLSVRGEMAQCCRSLAQPIASSSYSRLAPRQPFPSGATDPSALRSGSRNVDLVVTGTEWR